jgi:hypothetical protein
VVHYIKKKGEETLYNTHHTKPNCKLATALNCYCKLATWKLQTKSMRLKRQSTLHSHIAVGKQACNPKQVLSKNLKYGTLACYVLREQASETGKNRNMDDRIINCKQKKCTS